MYGVFGKVLEIDLGSKESRAVEVPEELYRQYLGGSSLACCLTAERLARAADPYSPHNALTFMTGPFTGSGLTSTARYAVTALSPLTGYWGEATGSGLLAQNLKGTGYDGVIIVGKSESPVYLYISENGVEFRDAASLWGKTTFDTFDMVRNETDRRAQVAAIGPAGENLVRYACIARSGGGVAGRAGMGAVMGDKKLKAIAFRGTARPPQADPETFKNIAGEIYEQVDAKNDLMREYGTMGYIDIGMYLGDVPDHYFTRSVFPVQSITSSALRQKYTVKSESCGGCPINCKRKTIMAHKGLELEGPEYETTVSLGPLCGIYDLETICLGNYRCNSYGMDTISAGVCLAFAAYLIEQGLTTEEQLGFSFSFGDSEKMLEMIEKIALREGAGDLLAEGTKRMAEKLQVDPGLAAHVKGLEIPMHEPRAFEGLAISYATGPRGACHQRADFYTIELGNGLEMGFMPGDRFDVRNRVQEVINFQDYREVYNALVMCNFASLSLDALSRLLNAATGWEIAPGDIFKLGSNSTNIKRKLNCELGLTPAEDTLPSIVCRPLKEGGAAGKELDMPGLIQEYYRLRNW